MLEENVSKLIHSLAEKQPSLKPKEVGNKIEVIISYLEELIGKKGAQIIQTVSIKHLCAKLKQEYEEVEAHFLFLDEIYEMKFKLLALLLNEKQSPYN